MLSTGATTCLKLGGTNFEDAKGVEEGEASLWMNPSTQGKDIIIMSGL